MKILVLTIRAHGEEDDIYVFDNRDVNVLPTIKEWLEDNDIKITLPDHMKIEQPTENSLYVTIGNFTYYFDDSIDGEVIVQRWHKDNDPMKDEAELLQTAENE